MTTAAVDETLLPGLADVAFYRRFYRKHGWWISPVILPPDVLDAAERGMQRYYAGDLDTPDDTWAAPPAEGLRKNDYASLHVHELARLVAQPLIAATAARLARTASASGTTVSGLDFFSQDLAALEKEITRQGHTLDIRPSRMRRGQVSFHHCRTCTAQDPTTPPGRAAPSPSTFNPATTATAQAPRATATTGWSAAAKTTAPPTTPTRGSARSCGLKSQRGLISGPRSPRPRPD
jgi:hypothetical protein